MFFSANRDSHRDNPFIQEFSRQTHMCISIYLSFSHLQFARMLKHEEEMVNQPGYALQEFDNLARDGTA